MQNLDKYFDSLLESAENLDIKKPVITHASIYSLGVVNSEGNGKRIVFSKALARKLQLEDSVDIVPLKDKGVVLVAKELSSKKAIQCKLSGKDRKICYSAGLVQLLIETFKLDYSEHVSRSFREVEFDERGGTLLAAIKLADPIIDDATDGGDA